jgi:carboxylesterase type B
VHGGSYLAGAASAPGLDGSQLALIGKMVVVVLQYRLGVLGQLPPVYGAAGGDPNLALNDVINGLSTVKVYASALRGNAAKVTVAGQSSGASMVRGMSYHRLSQWDVT